MLSIWLLLVGVHPYSLRITYGAAVGGLFKNMKYKVESADPLASCE